jgi:hypothetical protein
MAHSYEHEQVLASQEGLCFIELVVVIAYSFQVHFLPVLNLQAPGFFTFQISQLFNYHQLSRTFRSVEGIF